MLPIRRLYRCLWILILAAMGCNPAPTILSTAKPAIQPTATAVPVSLPTDLPNPIPTYTPTYRGSLTIEKSPWVEFSDDIYSVIGGATVKIMWINTPLNLEGADFYQVDSSGGMILLGSDRDKKDGISLDWFAPRGYRGQITAIGLPPFLPTHMLTIHVPAT